MINRRLKNLFKAASDNVSDNKWKTIPRYYSFVSNSHRYKVEIVEDDYTPKEEYLNSNNNIPFITFSKDGYAWLNEFTSVIEKDESNINEPIFNYKLDITNPEICAFCPNKNGNIMFDQIQVHKNAKKPWLYQLDCYTANSKNKMIRRMIGLCDVSEKNDSVYDLVYNNTDQSFNKALNALNDVVEQFRNILIYMRLWDYDVENASKIINITPMYAFKA